MEKLKVKIDKSPIPMIWLDTSILLKITKTQLGEIANNSDKEKYQYLNDSIKDKMKKKKLICPSADQFEEIEIGGRLEEEFQKVQSMLSLGIKINHRQSIEEFMINKFMKSFIDNENEIQLSYRDIFDKEPIRELENAIQTPFIIYLNSTKPTELVEKEKEIKKFLPKRWEELRREKVKEGVTFEEEREKEFESYFRTLFALSNKSMKNILQGNFDIYDLANAQSLTQYKTMWDYYGGQPPGLEGLSLFFSSDYFRQIPTIEIACNIRARIATQSNPIKSGDYMDIELVSAVIPFFDIVITDGAMRHCLNLLGYPKKYKCRIFSISEFKEIKSILNSL